QGIVRDLSFELPAAVKLRTVVGPDVGGWELVGDEAARKLRVFLRRNVGDQTELTIDGFLNSQLEQDTAVSAPGIAPLEVTAEVGHVAVYAGSQFSVRAAATDSLMQVDATQFAPSVPVTRLEHAPQLAYRFNRRPWTLDLRINRLATQLRATVQQGVRVSHRKTQITAKVVCDLSLVPRSSLELVVPADWLVLDVQSPGLRDWYRTLSDNRAVLTLDYEQPQQGSLQVVLLASESRTAATAAVSLSVPQVTGAHRQQRQLAVWFDSGLTGRAAALNGWRALDPNSIAGEIAQLRRVPVQLAFESAAEAPGSVDLTVEQMQPRLTADSLAVVTVTDVGVVYGLVLQWQIDRAAAETLVFETPSWLAGRLQFDRSHIRDVTETASADGTTTRWTIRLRGPVSGRFLIAASAVLPPVTDRVLAPALSFLSSDGAAPLETQRHYVLLSNASLSQLTNDDPALTEPVQREDVNLVVRPELVQQATEFVRLKTAGRAPSWTVQRYAPAANIPAAVNLADLVTVLARDGSYRTAATLTLKNRTRQFLAVRLPNSTRLLSVLVSGQPARAVETQLGDGPVLLIALPKTSAVDLSFPVQVVYAGRLPRSLPLRSDWQMQKLDVPTIEVVSQKESSEFGIPVARTQWTVYLPDDLNAAPLTDPGRHNLNRAREVELQESAVQVLISDAEGLVEALSDVSGVKGRVRAYNNLKQLDTELKNYSEFTSGNEPFRQKAEVVRGNLEKLKQSLETGRPEPSLAISGTVQSNDANLQWGNAIANNGFVFTDNRNQPDVQLGDQIDRNFNFIIPESARPMSRTEDVAELAKQAAQLGRNSVSFEARQQYQVLNEEALSRLNTSISGKKLADGQEAAPQQQQGGQFSGLQQMQRRARFAAPQPRGDVVTRGGAMGQPGVAGTPQSSWMAGDDGVEVQLGATIDGRRSGADGVHSYWFDNDADGVRDRVLLDLDDLVATDGILAFGTVPGRAAGVGGGGFGGGGGGEFDGELGGANAARGWTQAGGLSLLINVPTAGQKLVFSKAGGDAKLGLAVRPQASVSLGLGGLWFVGWMAVALLLLMSLRTVESRRRLCERLPLAVCVLSGLAVLLAPAPWHVLAWAVFAVTAGCVAWTHRDPATNVAA
ncbi:MAG: hypothetical protein SH850_24255, partial [Planctomycetaceae bacterium]|nr:hypothetical protein [Planctomycetaceae bacterium]